MKTTLSIEIDADDTYEAPLLVEVGDFTEYTQGLFHQGYSEGANLWYI